jgi:hypothetical protein
MTAAAGTLTVETSNVTTSTAVVTQATNRGPRTSTCGAGTNASVLTDM